jgi:hypothetical protein
MMDENEERSEKIFTPSKKRRSGDTSLARPFASPSSAQNREDAPNIPMPTETEVEYISKRFKEMEGVVKRRSEYQKHKSTQVRETQAQEILRKYIEQMSENIYMFLRYIQDDILLLTLRDPSLSVIFEEYLRCRGDFREVERIELRDFLLHFILNQPAPLGRQYLKLLSIALGRLLSYQVPFLTRQLEEGNRSWLKMARIALRETLPMWILGIVYVKKVGIVYRRSEHQPFTHAFLVNVPLRLRRIWDCKDHAAFEELAYSQWGISARQWLFPTQERKENKTRFEVPPANNHGHWPSIEAEIDWIVLQRDENLFHHVFQNVNPQTRHEFYAHLSQSQRFPCEILLNTAYHRTLINKQEKAALKHATKLEEDHIQSLIVQDREWNLHSHLSEQELYAFYKRKTLNKPKRNSVKRKYGSSNIELTRDHYVKVQEPFVFGFKARSLLYYSCTESMDLWSTTEKLCFESNQHYPEASMEMVQLFEISHHHLSGEATFFRSIFPQMWQEVVHTLQMIFADHLNKSKDSQELAMIFQFLVPYVLPYP